MPAFRLYDTLTREVREVRTAQPGRLTFYSCGPTVYSYAHIGNFRTFLTADLVVRTAQALGWKVSYVTNITDVGHLTEDDVADAQGQDKMERALKSKEGEQFIDIWSLSEHYAQAFQHDWRRLNLLEPMVWPKATQYITEQIDAVQRLVELGKAYETPTGVYFSVASFDGYGGLSGNRPDDLYTGVRQVVQDENKRSPADFALWKKDDKHLMQWYSPWGKGFPGWHIECSVMAMAYLGETIDLHGGGEDLVFPHHECEIAQSESLTGRRFANHWIHTRFLQVNGEKMAKSAGNFFTVRDLVDIKGANPLALRYALISVPYGKPLNFTFQTLRDATKNVERIAECRNLAAASLSAGVPGDDQVGTDLDALFQQALEAMCDDLNTSVALAKTLEGTGVIFRLGQRLSAASAKSAISFLDRIEELLGIVGNPQEEARAAVSMELEEEIEKALQRRDEAKRNRDYALADSIREELADRGIELRDTPEGTQWVRRPVI